MGLIALTGESDDKTKAIKPTSMGGDIFMLSGSSLATGMGFINGIVGFYWVLNCIIILVCVYYIHLRPMHYSVLTPLLVFVLIPPSLLCIYAYMHTGYAHVLVSAVGESSRWGKTKAKLAAETVDTPLQEKLDKLAGQIGNMGMAAAAATFVAMLVLWFLYPENRDPEQVYNLFLLLSYCLFNLLCHTLLLYFNLLILYNCLLILFTSSHTHTERLGFYLKGLHYGSDDSGSSGARGSSFSCYSLLGV